MQAKICCSKCCRQTKPTRTRLGQLDQTQVSALCRKPETSYCGVHQIPRHVVLKLKLMESYFPYHPYASTSTSPSTGTSTSTSTSTTTKTATTATTTATVSTTATNRYYYHYYYDDDDYYYCNCCCCCCWYCFC